MHFLLAYPLVALLIIGLSHYFIWVHLPHEFLGNEYKLKVEKRMIHQLRWIPFLFGTLIMHMSFQLAYTTTPLWFDLSTPLAFTFSAKMIGIIFAKKKLRKEWLERALLRWTKEGKGSVIVCYMGTERQLYCKNGELIFSLEISVQELTHQVQNELDLIYRRVNIRGGNVYVLLGKQPTTIAALIESCKALPEMKSISFCTEREFVLVER